MYIRTNPPAVMIADGETEYRVDVLGDTTEHPGVKFSAWEGRLWVPAGLECVGVEHPDALNNPSQNPDDFFYNWGMFENPQEGIWNSVHMPTDATGNSTWPWRTPMNTRYVGPGCQGPEDSENRLLGSWYFRVNTDAVARENVKFWSSPNIAVNTAV